MEALALDCGSSVGAPLVVECTALLDSVPPVMLATPGVDKEEAAGGPAFPGAAALPAAPPFLPAGAGAGAGDFFAPVDAVGFATGAATLDEP